VGAPDRHDRLRGLTVRRNDALLPAWLAVVFGLLCLLSCAAASAPAAKKAPQLPALAVTNAPLLVSAQRSIWPDAPAPAFLAGQVEQESCISLTHSKCWSPRAELKTSREYGFGVGQFTIAYRADGSVRFNKWLELRQRYPSLKSWTWDNRFDTELQMVAFVEMMKSIYARFHFIPEVRDRLGFSLSGYNGGDGAAMQDRVLCRNTEGCDPNRWFDHVEKHSMKSRVPQKGYGKSFFEINREYPHLVLDVRRQKYEPFFTKRAKRWNRSTRGSS
jgi:hypothetical protein